MPSKETKILEFSQYQKSANHHLLFYANLECLMEKING